MVFCGGADGNPYPVGEFVAGHGSDDHAFLEHFLEDLIAVLDADENEISGGGDEFEAALFEGSFVKRHPLAIDLAGFLDVVFVIESGESGGLRDGVGVERLAGFLE